MPRMRGAAGPDRGGHRDGLAVVEGDGSVRHPLGGSSAAVGRLRCDEFAIVLLVEAAHRDARLEQLDE